MTVKSLTIREILSNYSISRQDIEKLSAYGIDSLFIPDGTQALYACGYMDHRYKVVDNDDLIRIRVYDGEDPGDDEVIIEKDYYLHRREFNREVGKLAEEYHIPFLVAVTIGTDRSKYQEIQRKLSRMDDITIRQLRFLKAESIYKNKLSLKEVLGDELYAELDIESWGRKHSHRLAEYVSDCAMNRAYDSAK